MQNPRVVLIVGSVGLAFNILGLFVFHQHSHSHEETEHVHDQSEIDELSHAEHGYHEHHPPKNFTDTQKPLSPNVSRRIDDPARHAGRTGSSSNRQRSISSNRSMTKRRPRARSNFFDDIHPASVRQNIREHARMPDFDQEQETSEVATSELEDPESMETTPLLNNRSNRSLYKKDGSTSQHRKSPLPNGTAVHKNHFHRQPKEESQKQQEHSHSDMNIKGLFLHVLGDALGNVGVMASALIIWLTTSPTRYYADPAISLIITLIILKTAVPMCKDTAKPLLQATPGHINVDNIKKDIQDLSGVRSCHDVHVWALTPSKPVATLDVELEFNFDGANAARYMKLAKEIKTCLHEHGIHSSTIQPEFCVDSEHKEPAVQNTSDHASHSSTSTVHTVVANGPAERTLPHNADRAGHQKHPACHLDCTDRCTVGKQCCGPGQNGNAKMTEDSTR